MKFIYKGCTYRTENLSDDMKKNPDIQIAIKKIEKREAELKELEEKPIEVIKKAYKKQDEY